MSDGMVRLAVVAALGALLANASGAASAEQSRSETPFAIAESGPKKTDPPRITGVVLEVLDSGNNTYLRIDTGAKELWVATPRIVVSVGDAVSMPEGARVIDFYSVPLNRRFESLVFVSTVHVGGGKDAPSGIPRAHVVQTIEQVFSRRDEFVGQEVLVRGMVVESSAGKRNRKRFLVQDGTAGPDGDTELPVVTGETVPVGSTVLIRGLVVAGEQPSDGSQRKLLLEASEITLE